ncbi:potassium channel family protein [uncultured Kordia sp.]|uniref:potassium channel family protein n=1 Tax=uncultured Kordia sp. TaxID=507699 RepID=UPI0026039891|nr:potassium channel family protein [uncultured Kordia sp.]
MIDPSSFKGILDASHGDTLLEQLMYFSYITLLTIGYGDIVPVTAIARKATILIGLIGQIYLVIITSIIVGKYINQLAQTNEKTI